MGLLFFGESCGDYLWCDCVYGVGRFYYCSRYWSFCG